MPPQNKNKQDEQTSTSNNKNPKRMPFVLSDEGEEVSVGEDLGSRGLLLTRELTSRSLTSEPLFHHQSVPLINSETHVIEFHRNVTFMKQHPRIRSDDDGMPSIIHAILKTLKRTEVQGTQKHLSKFSFLSNLLSYPTTPAPVSRET